MSKKYNYYIKFLAIKNNILYISKNKHKIFDLIESYFLTASYVDLNRNILNTINLTLTKRSINFVIIDVEDNDELAIEFYKAIRTYNDEVPIMLMFNPKKYQKLFDIIPNVDMTISYPINNDIFFKRLFTLLSISHISSLIGKRELTPNRETKRENPLDAFLDTYEGSALFISDILQSRIKSLNSGELTAELLEEMAENIEAIADIFSKTSQTESVEPIFLDLANYLENIKLENISVESLKGFDYLSEILDEISKYLIDMFVERIFNDVYVFEHSLQNNIIFMKNKLDNKIEEDKDDLEFFND